MRALSLCVWLWVSLEALGVSGASAQSRATQAVVLLAPSLGSERALRAQVVAGLTSVQAEVVDVSALPDGDMLSACVAMECARTVMSAAHAAFAVRVSVVPSADPKAESRLELQLVASDGETAKVSLPLADPADVQLAAAEAFERARLSLGLGGDAVLRVSSVPTGASLTIDGAFAGFTPSNLRVKPGTHRLEVTLEGFVAAEQTVAASAGEVAPARLQLERARLANGDSAAAREPVVDYVLGSVLVLAALPAIVIPAETLARDGQCDGRRDAQGRCSNTVYFGTQSAVLLSVGTLALATGVYLFWATPFTVDAAVSEEGAKLTLSGRM